MDKDLPTLNPHEDGQNINAPTRLSMGTKAYCCLLKIYENLLDLVLKLVSVCLDSRLRVCEPSLVKYPSSISTTTIHEDDHERQVRLSMTLKGHRHTTVFY